jgi:prevent-host-death family protein
MTHMPSDDHTERVGIREMRQNLSRYAQRASQGESFLITDRGQEVAQLTPAPSRASAVDRLVIDRGARRAQGNLLAALKELPATIPGPPTSEVLDALRDERL